MARLTPTSGKWIDLPPGQQYVLGRDPSCDVVVDDDSCSRRHLLISVDLDGDCMTLQDLDSRNGTYLDGGKLTDVVFAPDESELRVGSTVFVISYQEVAELGETQELDTYIPDGA